jgi:hypothetical protein
MIRAEIKPLSILEGMASKDFGMFLPSSRTPGWIQLGEKILLPLEQLPAKILSVPAIFKLVVTGEPERDGLKNVIEKLIQLGSGQSLELLSPLGDDEVIASRIHFDVWPPALLGMSKGG